MRGVAALVVLVGHGLVGANVSWFSPLPVPRAYLAVDFFFLLSGFILARVYERRFVEGMTARQFMLQRYIRLYPLFLIGLTVGIVSALITNAMHRGSLPLGAIGTAATTELFMLPSPTWHYIPHIFPLNKPGWSLFFELVANAIYAFAWTKLSNRVLAVIVATSGAALIYLCAHGGGYGGAGWGDFAWGFPRVCFSFFLGVLIGRCYRSRFVQSPLAALLPIALLPILFLPQMAGPVLELVIAMLVFPLIVAAGASIEPRSPRGYVFLGSISYPLYAIHEPLLYFFWRVLVFFRFSPEQIAPASGIAFAALVIWLSWWLERNYDIPIRGWLTGKFVKRRHRRADLSEVAVSATSNLS